jgi:hypothetical protein
MLFSFFHSITSSPLIINFLIFFLFPEIKKNLIAQLTGPVKWTQSVQNMIKDGASNFVEVGPGKTLQGLIKKINSEVTVASAI